MKQCSTSLVLHSYNIVGLSMDSKRKASKSMQHRCFIPLTLPSSANINPQRNSTANGFTGRFQCVMLIANVSLILQLPACVRRSGLQRFGKLAAFRLHNLWFSFHFQTHSLQTQPTLQVTWLQSVYQIYCSSPWGHKRLRNIFFHICSRTARAL